MGRKRSDSPLSFPWEKLFSASEKDFEQAITYCSSDHMGSDIIKRAVTTVVSGYNSGSKVALCNKIKDKVNHIKQQILKTDNPNKTRAEVTEFYKSTFLKKFEGKVEGINNISIPPRPILPELSTEERKIYGSPPSSPRYRPSDVVEIEELELEPTLSDVTDESVLSANGIIYLSKVKPEEDGKIKKVSIKDFYEMLNSKYQGTPSAGYILDKNIVKKEMEKMIELLKKNKYKSPSTNEALDILEKASKVDRYGKGEVKNVIRLELPPIPSKAPIPSTVETTSIEIDDEIIIPKKVKKTTSPVETTTIEVDNEVKKQGISEEEIIKYIESKGWKGPSVKTKEKLCDYVLTKITKEDKKHEEEYNTLSEKLENYQTDTFALIEMLEERLKKLETMKKKRRVSFAEQNEIKIIENEASMIKEQIDEVKEEIENVKKQQEQIETEKEVKRQMCFKMKTWLDEDDFDKDEAVKDLKCADKGVCNVDIGECEPYSKKATKVGSARIKGSKQLVDKIFSKFTPKKQLVIEDDIEIPDIGGLSLEEEPKIEEEVLTEEQPKKQLVIEDEEMPDIGGLSLDEEPIVEKVEEEELIIPKRREMAEDISVEALRQNIENIARTTDINSLTSKSMRKDLSHIFGGIDFTSRKEEIREIFNEIIDTIREEVRSKTREILSEIPRANVSERDVVNKVFSNVAVLDIDFFRYIIEEEIKGVKSRCNTISLEDEVDDETRAKDLMCNEGEVCNLDMSMCVPESEAVEPVEELTIGGMLVKVSGSNNILEKLKQKIIKSGGSIAVEEPVVEKIIEEPVVENVVEEEKAEDVFESNIPGVRPTLEAIISGIKTITKSTPIVSEQTKIKIANRKCLERIAACAGINI